MTDARAWLDQVDARTNAATDGPWKVDGLDREGQYVTRPRDLDEWPEASMFFVTSTGSIEEDAEFIAAARTDLPAATAALRAVLDLHRPQAPGGNLVGDDFCHGCWEAGGCDAAPLWPCPTVTAVTTALEDA